MEPKTNGHADGNGSIKPSGKAASGTTNGHIVPPRRRAAAAKVRRSFIARSFSIIARLLTWYSIYTVLFRCPPALELCDDTSPRACKPYFQVKHAVAPHLTPYYETYAAPYVEVARPYYDKLDQVVITPSRAYAVKYGGPRVAQAQAYGQVQWEKLVQPELVKYQALAKAQYDASIAPHVAQATTVLEPYVDIARTNALQTYHEFLLPSFLYIQPYALRGYDLAYTFTTEAAIPGTLKAWDVTYAFLDSTVWPHVRNAYVVNVEPQLVRIGERLGRYKEIKPKAAVVDDAEPIAAAKSTFARPSSSIASSASTKETQTESFATEQISTKTTATIATFEDSEPMPTAYDTQDHREIAARTVADDLATWQDKFAKAADEGAAEIEERVDEISQRMVGMQANIQGKKLVAQLNQTAHEQLESLKSEVMTILEQSSSVTPENFDEQVNAAVRNAGLKIRDAAQSIRTWRQTYEQELQAAVTTIAEEHIEILNNIRDLAMQKLGMKWAWMEGVTYKHWQKYHNLRERLDEWTTDLKKLVVTHPGLEVAQNAGVDVENEGMAIAGEAAKELGRLKQVAAVKLAAGDFTDNFDSEAMERAAEAVAEAARQKAYEEAEAAKAAEEAAAAQVVEDEPQAAAEGLAEQAEEFVEEPVDGASSSVSLERSTVTEISSEETETVTILLSAVQTDAETDTETSVVPPLDSLTSEPTESATDLAASTVLPETPVMASNATSAAEPAETLASSEPADGPEQLEETIVEVPEEPTPSLDTQTVKSAMFGAAAQSVPTRQPIIDDEFLSSASDAAASLTSAAHSAYTAAIGQAAEQYARAVAAVSAQISGTPKPVHEELYSSASSAYFGALETASSKLGEAITAASEGIYGTPTPTGLHAWMQVPTMPSFPELSDLPDWDLAGEWEKIQSIAQQNYHDTAHWAHEQFEAAQSAASDTLESAKVAVGVAEPTPSTPVEHIQAAQKVAEERAQKVIEQARHNYYAGLGVAHARYKEFLSAASNAMRSLTATPTPTDLKGTASSVASVAQESVSSAYSAAGEQAAKAASVAGEAAEAAASRVAEAGETVTEYVSDLGDNAAKQWEVIVSRVSVEIYGQPTPTAWYENLYSAAEGAVSAAGEYAASATDAAAESAASVTSVAGDYADTASSAAASQYSAISSLISELVVGKEPTFSESVLSKLQAAYTAGAASVASIAGEASKTAVSAASEATEKVKETVDRLKDEL